MYTETERFDKALAALQDTPEGYKPAGSPFTFLHYMDNCSWQEMLNNMLPCHRAQFTAGSGGELEERNGYPPKMAAFASSSRMLYLLSKDIPDFRFEEKLPTTVGGIANLDGYLEKENCHIFVEAKCHEIYHYQGLKTVSQVYRPLYAWLREKMPRHFSCVMEDSADRQMQVVFFSYGEAVAFFDVKQMISHLLGIATKLLKNPDGKKVQFLYVLYDPYPLFPDADDNEPIFRKYESARQTAFDCRFAAIFRHIVDYLVEVEGISADPNEVEAIKSSFRFTLCDQTRYRSYL